MIEELEPDTNISLKVQEIITSSPLPQLALQAGECVPGGYVIGTLLGSGGYGAVYEGHDSGLDREVAIKVLTRSLDQNTAQRFRDEGRLLARIQNPHIIQVFYVDQLQSGHPFLVMERFGSGSIAEHWSHGEIPPIHTSLLIISQLLYALEAAHIAGIIHRDIKEGNLLYDPQSEVIKLCDFGIARSQEKLPNQAKTTKEGVLIGTDHYIAPERFQGVNDDLRSDLYSVGVLFYRLLTGKRPFERTPHEPINPEVLFYRIFSEEVKGLDQIPPRIARVCLKLLKRNPDERFQSARAVINALEDARSLPATQSTPYTMNHRSQRAHTLQEDQKKTLLKSRSKRGSKRDKFLTFYHSTLPWLIAGLITGCMLWWITQKENSSDHLTSTSSTPPQKMILLGEPTRSVINSGIHSKTKKVGPFVPPHSISPKNKKKEKEREKRSNQHSPHPMKKKERSSPPLKKSSTTKTPFIFPNK